MSRRFLKNFHSSSQTKFRSWARIPIGPMLDVATIREFLRSQRESARVLIVDDEPAICAALSMALEDLGWQSVSAETAEEACELLKSQTFQLLVSDKNLPLMSGLELFAHCKEIDPDLPMVMMTGYASIDSVQEAISIGAIDYIAKPFDDIFVIAAKLAKIVERRIHLATYEQVAGALQAEIRDRGHSGQAARLIGHKLGKFKQVLAESPDVIIFENEDVCAHIAAGFDRIGLKALKAVSKYEALRLLEQYPTVSVGVIALDHPMSTELLEALHGSRYLNVVMSCMAPDLRKTLEALSLGATDLYLRDVEDPDTLAARLQHTIKEVQREQLFMMLFSTLHDHSDHVGNDLLDLIHELAPGAERMGLDKSDAGGDAADAGGDIDDVLTLLKELACRS